jgi:hypothetical protein
MLAFERRFVDALLDGLPGSGGGGSVDPAVRSRVHEWVDGSLRTMPQHLRLGVAGESVLLAGWSSVAPGPLDALPAKLERSPVLVLRQYVRLFRSLVLFAEQELTPAP